MGLFIGLWGYLKHRWQKMQRVRGVRVQSWGFWGHWATMKWQRRSNYFELWRPQLNPKSRLRRCSSTWAWTSSCSHTPKLWEWNRSKVLSPKPFSLFSWSILGPSALSSGRGRMSTPTMTLCLGYLHSQRGTASSCTFPMVLRELMAPAEDQPEKQIK